MKVTRFIDDEMEKQRANLSGSPGTEDGPVVNVCGVLVHAVPDRAEAVCAHIRALPGAEIHLKEDDGRLVVTLEDTDDGLAAEGLAALSETPGVLNAALVYHHFEPQQSMEREEASS